ncbi:hypothetical protein DFH11DRAFT_1760442 [Phellopilus nigrolimitatus]|nr:hypothetical protein DFH11DRAFT_1760442 [Phellopilus nigrolimitatus]
MQAIGIMNIGNFTFYDRRGEQLAQCEMVELGRSPFFKASDHKRQTVVNVDVRKGQLSMRLQSKLLGVKKGQRDTPKEPDCRLRKRPGRPKRRSPILQRQHDGRRLSSSRPSRPSACTSPARRRNHRTCAAAAPPWRARGRRSSPVHEAVAAHDPEASRRRAREGRGERTHQRHGGCPRGESRSGTRRGAREHARGACRGEPEVLVSGRSSARRAASFC